MRHSERPDAFRTDTDEEDEHGRLQCRHPTEARQATTQRLNYRVLTRSLLIALVAAAFVHAYFYLQTPA